MTIQPTLFDYGVFAVLLASGLLGTLRGLVREILSLVGWALAFWVAYTYAGMAAEWIPASLPGGPFARVLLGFVLLLIATVIATALLSALLAQALTSAGLKPADRGLGFLFGLVRGAVLVLVLFALGGLTKLPQEQFWRDAVTRPYVAAGVRAVKPYLPEDIAKHIKVDDQPLGV